MPKSEPAEECSEVAANELKLPYTPFWEKDEGRILRRPGGGCDGDCDSHADCE